MRVLVTGATGFVGKNLVRHLLHHDYEVAILARRTSNLTGLPVDAIDVRWGDIRDAAAVRNALDGVEAVFHLAALVKEWVPRSALFREVNVEGLENVLRASMQFSLDRVVYTSSFMAIGPSDEAGEADESTTHSRNHFCNLYERTKYEAAIVADRFAKLGAPVVTVCPGVVYGPGDLTAGNIMVRHLKDFLTDRLPGIPGSGTQRWSFSYVDDVVSGHRLAMEKGKVGEKYILGGENVPLKDFFAVAMELTGRTKPPRHVPFWLLETVAALGQAKAAITRKPPAMALGAVRAYRHNWAYTSGKSIAELGYTITPLREGVARTIEWMKTQNLI